jgi:ABC-type phosphate/phosphonate transport system substrate-binding protein
LSGNADRSEIAVSLQERLPLPAGHLRGNRHLSAGRLLVLGLLLSITASFTSPRRFAAAESTAPPRSFFIGYLESESGGPLNREWFRRLVMHLNTDPATAELREALIAAGYRDFAFESAEGYRDLVARMENTEWQCVFCPAVAFVRQIDASTTSAILDVFRTPYRVVFQIRRPEDVGNPPRRFGAIFVNRNHPLYRPPRERKQPVDPATIARAVASESVAFVSRYSAPGYIYPLNGLFDTGVVARPARPVFRESSAEVVKTVLTDVVGIGACRITAIEEVLAGEDLASSASDLVDVVLTTDGSPADPIVFLDRFAPDRSDLGKRLREAIQRYFAGPNRPGALRLVASDNLEFRPLKQAVELFDSQLGGGRDGP